MFPLIARNRFAFKPFLYNPVFWVPADISLNLPVFLLSQCLPNGDSLPHAAQGGFVNPPIPKFTGLRSTGLRKQCPPCRQFKPQLIPYKRQTLGLGKNSDWMVAGWCLCIIVTAPSPFVRKDWGAIPGDKTAQFRLQSLLPPESGLPPAAPSR